MCVSSDVAAVAWVGVPTQRGAGRDRAHPTVSVSQCGRDSQGPAGIGQLDDIERSPRFLVSRVARRRLAYLFSPIHISNSPSSHLEYGLMLATSRQPGTRPDMVRVRYLPLDYTASTELEAEGRAAIVAGVEFVAIGS